MFVVTFCTEVNSPSQCLLCVIGAEIVVLDYNKDKVIKKKHTNKNIFEPPHAVSINWHIITAKTYTATKKQESCLN